MVVKRGEIWWATLPEPKGSEPGYRRPVLIIQADEFSKSAIRSITCAAITSNLRLAAAPGNVRAAARATGLPKPSVVNVSQILTLDKTFLTERIKKLDSHTMHLVDDGLRLAMNL